MLPDHELVVPRLQTTDRWSEWNGIVSRHGDIEDYDKAGTISETSESGGELSGW